MRIFSGSQRLFSFIAILLVSGLLVSAASAQAPRVLPSNSTVVAGDGTGFTAAPTCQLKTVPPLAIATNHANCSMDAEPVVATDISPSSGAGYLAAPNGLAVDAAGNLYIGGQTNPVLKVDTAGMLTTFAGGFNKAAIGSGSLCDAASQIQPNTNTGGLGCPANESYIKGVRGIVIAPMTIAGGCTDANCPAQNTISNGEVYPIGIKAGDIIIADTANSSVLKVEHDTYKIGQLLRSGTSTPGIIGGSIATYTKGPNGMAFDKQGRLYVAEYDSTTNDIMMMDFSTDTWNFIAGSSSGTYPTVTPTHIRTTVANCALPDSSAYYDKPAYQVSFSQPTDVSFDAAGNLYIVDSLCYKVRKLPANPSTGLVDGTEKMITIAGIGVQPTAGPPDNRCPATNAYCGATEYAINPTSVKALPNGDLFIGTGDAILFYDHVTQNLQRVLSTGIGGSGKMALDAWGNLYHADNNNNVVRKITLGTNVLGGASTTAIHVAFGDTCTSFDNPADFIFGACTAGSDAQDFTVAISTSAVGDKYEIATLHNSAGTTQVPVTNAAHPVCQPPSILGGGMVSVRGATGTATLTAEAGIACTGPVTITATSGPANGSISIDPSGVVTYTPNAGFIGNDPVTFKATQNDVPIMSTVTYDSGASSISLPSVRALDSVGTVTVTFHVVPLTPLTITADNQSMLFGGPLPTLTYTTNPAGVTLATPPTCTTTVTVTSVPGAYPISCSDAVDPDYTISYTAGTLTINPAPLTVTADAKSMNYGGPLPTFTYHTTPSVTLATQPTCTTTATVTSVPGTYPITCSGAVDANYTISYAAGTLTINPAPLTVTADAKSMNYGGPLPTFTFTTNPTGVTLSTLPTCTTTAALTSVPGTYPINCSGGSDARYSPITYVAGTLTVTAAPVTVTADNQSMPFGGPLPTFTYHTTPSVTLATPPTCTTTAAVTSVPGTYPITCSGAVDANYTISYTAGTLTINPAPLTVTADAKSMNYGGSLPTFTFTTNPAGVTLSTPPTCTTTATVTSVPGPYPINCSGGSDARYSPITYVAGTLTVSQAPLTVTADNQTMPFGGPLPAFTFTTTPAGVTLATLPTCTTTATGTSALGTYPITCSGGADARYAPITYVAGTLTVTAAPVMVTADNASMKFGGPLPTFTYHTTPSVTLATPPTCTTTATLTSVPGTYPINCSGAVDANYTISYTAGTLTVSPVPLAVTADAKSMNYGGPLPTFTFTTNPTGVTLSTLPTCTTTATLTSVPGTYPINCSGGSDARYSPITYVAGTLTVTAAPVTVTADNQSMPFGGPLPTFTYHTTPPVTLATPPTCTTTATVTSVPGTYPITCSEAADANYTISYTAGTLTVDPAPLTVTADAKSMIYGGPLPTFTFTTNPAGVTLSTPPTCTTTATVTSVPGPYPINCSGGSDARYSPITYVAEMLTVNQAPLTVTADDKSMPKGGPLPTLTFTTNPAGVTLATLPTCTTTATGTSALGTYPITCSGGADARYSPITYVDGTLTVTAAPVIVTADNASMNFAGPLPTFTYHTTPSVTLATPPTCTTTATLTSVPGTYPINCSGAVDANYTISYTAGTLTVSPVPLAVTADAKSMNYGGPLPTFTFTTNPTGVTLSTLPTCTTTATLTSVPGTYPINCSGGSDAGYSPITYVAGTLTVNAAPLTVTADDKTMPSGGPLPAFTFHTTPAGVTLATLPTCTTTATTTSAVGTYPINCSGGSDARYSPISYTAGTLTVTGTLTLTTATGGSSTATVTAGQTAVYNLQATGWTGATGSVSFTCTGAPNLATCTVSPNPANINGATAVPVTVSITTTGATSKAAASLAGPGPGTGNGLPIALALTLTGLLSTLYMTRKGKVQWRAAGACAVLLVVMSLSACGGKSNSDSGTSKTPAGTYTVTVTGTGMVGSTNVTKSMTLTLNVQ